MPTPQYNRTDDRTGEALLDCPGCGEVWPEARFEDELCPDCRGEVSCQFCGAEATTTVPTSVRGEPAEETPACDDCADREGHDE